MQRGRGPVSFYFFLRKPCTRGAVDPRRLGLLSGRRGRASGSRTPCFPTSGGRRWPARGVAAAAASSRAARFIGDGRHPATSRGAAFPSAATPGSNRRRCPSPTRRCRGTRASPRADGWEPPKSAVSQVGPLAVLMYGVLCPGHGVLHPRFASSRVGGTQVRAKTIGGQGGSKLRWWADDTSLEESNDGRSTTPYLDAARCPPKPSMASPARTQPRSIMVSGCERLPVAMGGAMG